jgi:DNA (cytosine-5)-methyltransferase 1
MLENVVSMTSTRTGLEDQNVLSQLVACLVAMGYQVNQYIMDSWSYGSAQHRSRVFIIIAAPGLEPIIQPWHTHSGLSEDTVGRSLGKLPNGQRLGEREYYPTPFAQVCARDITSDLPDIGNANVQICVSYPDHRVSHLASANDRALLRCIPRQPPGCGYREAYNLDLIPPALHRPGKEVGKAFRRVKEAGLIPTITTNISVHDSRNGATVHWWQHRALTILDARRAQGYPDHEPIIGNLTEKLRIVGNGVDRKVSFALGLALHQAMKQNMKNGTMPTFRHAPGDDVQVDGYEKMDTTSDDNFAGSVIAAKVPSRRQRNFPKTITPGGPSRRPQARAAPEISEEPQGRTLRYGANLDGSSDVRRSSSRELQNAKSSPTTSSSLSRISANLTRGLQGLSLRPSLSTVTPETKLTFSKRRREEYEDEIRQDANQGNGHTISSKRAKLDKDPQPPTPSIDRKESNVTRESTAERKKRATRHSGLEVAFMPRNWNKRPEREHALTE